MKFAWTIVCDDQLTIVGGRIYICAACDGGRTALMIDLALRADSRDFLTYLIECQFQSYVIR